MPLLCIIKYFTEAFFNVLSSTGQEKKIKFPLGALWFLPGPLWQWAREEPKCAKTHVWGFIFYKSRGNVWISRGFSLKL